MKTTEVLSKILEGVPQKLVIRKKDDKQTFEALEFVNKARDRYAECNGVANLAYIQISKGHLRATDGHRLHFTLIQGIPDGLYSITKKNSTFTLELVKEEKYPDIDTFLKTSKFPNKVMVDRKDFLRCAKQAKIMTSTTYHGIELCFNGQLQIKAVNPDLGDMETQTEIDKPISPEVKVGINCSYLITALQKLKSKQISVKVWDHQSPMMFSDGTKNALIMPMRL